MAMLQSKRHIVFHAKILENADVLSGLKGSDDIYYDQYKQLLNLLKDDSKPRSEVQGYVSKSYKYFLQRKRKLDDAIDGIDSEVEVEEQEDSKKQRTEEGLRIDWKLCLKEGEKALGWDYKNSESLRSQFYN